MLDEFGNEVAEVETPEIDYSKLDPSKIPHDVIEKTQAFGGLLGETRELRSGNQTLQLQLNEKLSEDDDDPAPKDDDDTAPDDFITREQMEKKLEAQKKDLETQQAAKDATTLQDNQNKSTVKFLESTTAEEKGEGLDAKTVISETTAHLQAHDKEMFAVIMRKPDAARRLYEYGIAMVPALRDRHESHRNEKFLSTLKTGGGSRGGGSSAGSQGNALADLIGMPEDKLLESIEADLDVDD